jgi:hypothetical protein
MYNAAQLSNDAAGYGHVSYLAKGTVRINAGGQPSARSPPVPASFPLLKAEIASSFLGELYSLVWTIRPITIYRFYGTNSSAAASLLGAFWTPARPSLRIDRLGYESSHDTSRANLALQRAWNPMTNLAEADLGSGAHIYIGRVAPQSELGVRFGGGSIQFFVPSLDHRLHLKRNYGA